MAAWTWLLRSKSSRFSDEELKHLPADLRSGDTSVGDERSHR